VPVARYEAKLRAANSKHSAHEPQR
jgi:hypothetical protein